MQVLRSTFTAAGTIDFHSKIHSRTINVGSLFISEFHLCIPMFPDRTRKEILSKSYKYSRLYTEIKMNIKLGMRHIPVKSRMAFLESHLSCRH